MKRIVSLLLAVILLLTFTACGNDTQKDYVEIEFYQQNEADVELFDKIISDFEKKNPGIKVKQINLPEEESGSVLNTGIQNNDSPDIYNEWFGEDMFNKVELGVVRDLTDSPLCNYISEAALKQNAYKDKYYLFAMNGQTGKFIGDMPVDKGKVVKWSIWMFIILCLVLLVISYVIFKIGVFVR